jgi:hypothetical protein
MSLQWITGIPLTDIQPSDDYRAGEIVSNLAVTF